MSMENEVNNLLGIGVIVLVAAVSPTVYTELGPGVSPTRNEFVLIFLPRAFSCFSSLFFLMFSEISFNFL